MPSGVSAVPHLPGTLAVYARRFLQSAVKHGVRVLGVTPHSPRVGTADGASAVWQIVEEWNCGDDDDDIPFREKIYAVFPGFEPSLNNGKSGLHMLFLFDPEIGRANYLKAFDLVMGGVSPWPSKPDNQLRLSSRTAEEAFDELRKFRERECPKTEDGALRWNYITLAPHIDDEKGLLGAQRAEVLQLFQHDEIAGLELGDNKLPPDALENRPVAAGRHGRTPSGVLPWSDAYSVDEIGRRHTWLKLASPRIEGLRQAFIASDSRMRIGYERSGNGALSEMPSPPDITMNQRPWLQSVTVAGRASFFGTGDGDERGTRFDLSPDLTCVIGGSMTGKSTFLDGLRVRVEAPLPQDDTIRQQVEARARDRFLGGSADVRLKCPAGTLRPRYTSNGRPCSIRNPNFSDLDRTQRPSRTFLLG